MSLFLHRKIVCFLVQRLIPYESMTDCALIYNLIKNNNMNMNKLKITYILYQYHILEISITLLQIHSMIHIMRKPDLVLASLTL